jgi:hypothetical protein
VAAFSALGSLIYIYSTPSRIVGFTVLLTSSCQVRLLERDNGTCAVCERRGSKFTALTVCTLFTVSVTKMVEHDRLG